MKVLWKGSLKIKIDDFYGNISGQPARLNNKNMMMLECGQDFDNRDGDNAENEPS